MQKQDLVIQIDFIDRLGLGYDVMEVLKKHSINLLAMEAKANQEMRLKFKYIPKEKLNNLIADLKKIDGVLSLTFRDQMQYEQREDQLTTILNSVSEGIIAVNKSGHITHINEKACEIFSIKETVIGEQIEDVLKSDIPIMKTLQYGKKYNLKEIKYRKNGKLFHYLTSGCPIVNEKGYIIGAVATIKDFKQVEEIVSKIDRKKRLTTFNDIVYQSDKMRNVVDTAKMVAKGDSSVLLRGESGTGKELFARAIHMESNRNGHPFIAINCAALPESLLESELFGYEEGTFTGAAKGGRKGLFEQADKGTLFLDEIGEISPQIQVRLLRVLQENAIRRVGGNREISIDVRIIAATHRNLEEMVEKGEFREDLYYRLNVIPLRIPPLRERVEDIPLIAQHLIKKIGKKLNKSNISLSEEAIQYLMEQKWPGNVRQLENTLERIINVVNQEEIKLEHFYEWGHIDTKKYNVITYDKDIINLKIPIKKEWPSLKEIVSEVEKQVLLKVLKTNSSSRKAGKVLGVSNTTILNKMKNYGIKIEDID
ncbi:diguanylate cyclase [Vulcanibacillus modesticaldus]|uniref:HTH-type transcriptional regulatory protein TyrR n=1 Tax=Vulcanibacillus modesticaldus TaxID=337097 RepID=A0A1D2YT31_9BACI|nr:sigma 54-interacting transcriptional regulator [Vulcanibacillus modesticaldus]OEF98841.1 diguanylate cyclase [Vulcanibacillus modesticaldus]